MSAHDCMAAKRKMQLRYRHGKRRTVHEAVAAERIAAARSRDRDSIKRSKKK